MILINIFESVILQLIGCFKVFKREFGGPGPEFDFLANKLSRKCIIFRFI